MSATDSERTASRGSLYAARKAIYPKEIEGTFRRIKWGLLGFTLAVYYLLPFVRWDRGPGAPSQAVLVDFPHRRFYFFFIEIWPQEVYYLTGLLILAALTLFLMNAIAGRVWCGYLCPQTVWTDLYLSAERWIEGDARERARKDAMPRAAKVWREKIAKHALWLVIAWWTGGAWVLYFADAPTLVWKLATFQPGISEAYVWIGVFTFTTYLLAGHMREQVCLFMCPWPRIQAALTDEHALNVTYRYDRGEPRMSLKHGLALRAAGGRAGDCVDCGQCVAVCPTGVDIRKGASLGCVQCGLCIDACDAVMEKIGRASRLIAYDTQMNCERRKSGAASIYKPLRARTLIYATLILAICGAMSLGLATRGDARLSVIHDRNPLAVRLSDGALRNAYTVRFANMSGEPRRYALDLEGLGEAELEIVGVEPDADGRFVVAVGPDQTREARVLVTLRGRGAGAAQTPIVFVSRDLDSGAIVETRDSFLQP